MKAMVIVPDPKGEGGRLGMARRFSVDVLLALADGRLRPIIDREFSLKDALAVQNYLASNAQLGKIVLVA